METIALTHESPVLGKTPKDLNLGGKTGILIVAIGRNEELIAHRLGEVALQADDVIYCIGKETDFINSTKLITG